MIKWLLYIISTTTTVYYLVLMSIPAITLHAKREPELMSSFQATSSGVFFLLEMGKTIWSPKKQSHSKMFLSIFQYPKKVNKGYWIFGNIQHSITIPIPFVHPYMGYTFDWYSLYVPYIPLTDCCWLERWRFLFWIELRRRISPTFIDSASHVFLSNIIWLWLT